MRKELTQEYLKSILFYDPGTGVFTWNIDRRKLKKGDTAGNVADGYMKIKINSYFYTAHRLAFLYMTGSFPFGQVDHEDTNKLNNIFRNLRVTTQSGNSQNRKQQRNNTSGFKGVYWESSKKLWRAMIGIEGKQCGLGRFKDKYQAAIAYDFAAIELHGKFARTNFEYK